MIDFLQWASLQIFQYSYFYLPFICGFLLLFVYLRYLSVEKQKKIVFYYPDFVLGFFLGLAIILSLIFLVTCHGESCMGAIIPLIFVGGFTGFCLLIQVFSLLLVRLLKIDSFLKFKKFVAVAFIVMVVLMATFITVNYLK